MAPLSYICQSLSFCYTDLFCCSSRRQSLSAPTATTAWTCPKLETMGLDGCIGCNTGDTVGDFWSHRTRTCQTRTRLDTVPTGMGFTAVF
jgi:hypothetical protein